MITGTVYKLVTVMWICDNVEGDVNVYVEVLQTYNGAWCEHVMMLKYIQTYIMVMWTCGHVEVYKAIDSHAVTMMLTKNVEWHR